MINHVTLFQRYFLCVSGGCLTAQTAAFDARMEAPLWRRVPVSPVASCCVTIKEWRHRMPQVSPTQDRMCFLIPKN